MKRQPRATARQGGFAPSLGPDRDPRARRRQQPVVPQDTVRSQAIQRLQDLPPEPTLEELGDAVREINAILRGDD